MKLDWTLLLAVSELAEPIPVYLTLSKVNPNIQIYAVGNGQICYRFLVKPGSHKNQGLSVVQRLWMAAYNRYCPRNF